MLCNFSPNAEVTTLTLELLLNMKMWLAKPEQEGRFFDLGWGLKMDPTLTKGRCPATTPTEVHSCRSTVVNVYSAGLETQRMNESCINCQQASGAHVF